jgi:L-threonylcarbamoyladenylate synthase
MYQTEIGKDFVRASELLLEGELVAIPTETVYGLAGNAIQASAVAKIYEAKNRPQFNPLIVHVANEEQLKKYVVELTEDCSRLIKAFSPGPLTYLLQKNDLIPDITTAGSKKVALRIPNHSLTLKLLSSLDFPLAAPSANPSGYVSPVSAQHVYDGLRDNIPYILDGGESTVGIESTIVGFENGETIVHRLGGVSVEQIEKVLGKSIKISITHDAPQTPGQLKMHYSTKKPLKIGDINEMVNEYADKKIGILSFQKSYEGGFHQIVLSEKGELLEAASRLFSALREMDQQDVDIILSEYVAEVGIGRAINDRLRRASH